MWWYKDHFASDCVLHMIFTNLVKIKCFFRTLKVLEEILIPKLQRNLKVLEREAKDVKDKVHAMVSSVVIAYVFTEYHEHLKSEKCELLLKCLKLPPNKEVCSEFVKTINNFEGDTLRWVYDILGYSMHLATNEATWTVKIFYVKKASVNVMWAVGDDK